MDKDVVEIRRPTRAELAAAVNKTVPDLIGPNLKVLFVGINPGLYSGAVGHHFARPGNRFWPALHRGGLTDRVISPFEEREMLELGLGITNLVPRTTATADQLTRDELVAGAKTIARKVRRYRPKIVAFVGITAFRIAFNKPKAVLGEQEEKLADSRVWVLPNPSGLNAHHQLEDLGRMFAAVREAAEE